jgi:hypothetical protein
MIDSHDHIKSVDHPGCQTSMTTVNTTTCHKPQDPSSMLTATEHDILHIYGHRCADVVVAFKLSNECYLAICKAYRKVRIEIVSHLLDYHL